VRRLVVAGLVLIQVGLLAACSSGGSGSAVSNEPTQAPTTRYAGSLPLNTGPAPWPFPDHEIERTVAAGVPVYPSESLFYHVHAHLDVFVDGAPVIVPAGLGTSETLPRTKYQGHDIVSAPRHPCAQPCIAALPTHDDTGVLHTESDKQRTNTLGEVFGEWGVRFDGTCVGGYCSPQTPIAIYVNGTKVTTDPRQIALTDGKEIALVIGTPPATIPKSFG
jgi:hypothetical protein